MKIWFERVQTAELFYLYIWLDRIKSRYYFSPYYFQILFEATTTQDLNVNVFQGDIALDDIRLNNGSC